MSCSVTRTQSRSLDLEPGELLLQYALATCTHLGLYQARGPKLSCRPTPRVALLPGPGSDFQQEWRAYQGNLKLERKRLAAGEVDRRGGKE